MTPAQPLSSAARAGAGSSAARSANNGAPDGWTFRAPRHGDLVGCPYCANRLTACCDYCGDEGQLFASDISYFEENPYG